MKLQRSTLILVLVALTATASLYLFNRQVRDRQEGNQNRLNFAEAEVEAVAVTNLDTTLFFERIEPAEPGQSIWQMQSPKAVAANEATIAFLLSTLTSGNSSDEFIVSRDRLSEFGLESPISITTIIVDEQQQHQVLLGDADFSGEQRYALIDPPSEGDVTVTVVPLSFEYATVRPFTDWQAPAVEAAEASTAVDPPPNDANLGEASPNTSE